MFRPRPSRGLAPSSPPTGPGDLPGAKRAEIDVLLARQVCNVTKIARTYGVHHMALRRHRENHLPGFLPAFAAQADGLVQRTLMAEQQRLYLHALDNLARAEAGTLERVEHEDAETGEKYVEHRPKVSTSAVARAIREARGALGELVRLSAGEQPATQHGTTERSALSEAIREQLLRLAERQQLAPGARGGPTDATVVEGQQLVEDAVVVPDPPAATVAPVQASAGRHPEARHGQAGRPMPPTHYWPTERNRAGCRDSVPLSPNCPCSRGVAQPGRRVAGSEQM